MKFYPYKRRGGGAESFEVVLKWELEILAILMGGRIAKSFHPLRLDYGG